jgi:pimeloyl-ACP methyl ester carboxylesterase
MALIDTTLSGLDPEQVEAFRNKIRDRRDGAAYASYAEAIAAYRLVPEEAGVPDAVMRDIAHHALVERAPGEWCVRFDRGVLHGDGSGALFDELAGVRCPVRLAYARRAPREDDGEVATARERLRDVRVEEFEGGHHFFLARPEPLGEWLVEFLDSLGAGA